MKHKNEKTFKFHQILSAEDICSLTKEKNQIYKAIQENKKVVIYGSRNCGKTSLVKSVIVPKVQKNNKNVFIVFVDLMQVKDLTSIADRLELAFYHAFSRNFRGKSFISDVKKLLGSLRPKFDIDSNSGELSLSINIESREKESPQQILNRIFEIIREKIIPKRKVIMILDEFQDIHEVHEAEGIMRSLLESLDGVSVILMGSRKHLLSRIVSNPSSPLASFGHDIEFEPIPYEEYEAYIKERFDLKEISINTEVAVLLQNLMDRIPEAINILCSEIMGIYYQKKIFEKEVLTALESLLNNRQTRFEEQIATFTQSEEAILIQIAKHQPIKAATSVDFLKYIKMSHRNVNLIFKRLEYRAIIEKKSSGFILTDPLLRQYLLKYRVG